MLGKPTSYALDIDYTPLHPTPAPVALNQARILQGFEQTVGGHLAARASLGEPTDRPCFLRVVCDQLCWPQTACAQRTPTSRQPVAHAFGQGLARERQPAPPPQPTP